MEWLVGGGIFLFYLFVLVFIVGSVAVFIYALIDVIRMPSDTDFKAGTQIVWILVVLLAQGIGAILYLIVGRPPGGATAAREHPSPPRDIPAPPSGAIA